MCPGHAIPGGKPELAQHPLSAKDNPSLFIVIPPPAPVGSIVFFRGRRWRAALAEPGRVYRQGGAGGTAGTTWRIGVTTRIAGATTWTVRTMRVRPGKICRTTSRRPCRPSWRKSCALAVLVNARGDSRPSIAAVVRSNLRNMGISLAWCFIRPRTCEGLHLGNRQTPAPCAMVTNAHIFLMRTQPPPCQCASTGLACDAPGEGGLARAAWLNRLAGKLTMCRDLTSSPRQPAMNEHPRWRLAGMFARRASEGASPARPVL